MKIEDLNKEEIFMFFNLINMAEKIAKRKNIKCFKDYLVSKDRDGFGIISKETLVVNLSQKIYNQQYYNTEMNDNIYSFLKDNKYNKISYKHLNKLFTKKEINQFFFNYNYNFLECLIISDLTFRDILYIYINTWNISDRNENLEKYENLSFINEKIIPVYESELYFNEKMIGF